MSFSDKNTDFRGVVGRVGQPNRPSDRHYAV